MGSADNAFPVLRERDRGHLSRVARQGAHLQIALNSHQINAKTREQPSRKQIVAPPSAMPWVAHLGALVGVPDLDELVERPADDAFPVRRERSRGHIARVPRQGAHLPIELNSDQLRQKPPENIAKKIIIAPPGALPRVTHLGALVGVPDLDELVARPADNAFPVTRERDRGHRLRVSRQGTHLPIARNSDQINAKTRVQRSPKIQKLVAPPIEPSRVVHLGALVGVPDLDELVVRPADNAFPVPRERDRGHRLRVPRQGAHLRIALKLDRINAETRVQTSPKA